MGCDGYKDLTVLVVDDISTMRSMLRGVLKDFGFGNIMEAADGAMALSIVKRERVDLIISNWNMPKMSGLEFLKRVREDRGTENIPFLMLTSEGRQEYVLQAAKEKVSDYVIKPVTPKTLDERLERLLNTPFPDAHDEDCVIIDEGTSRWKLRYQG